jgi:hypothetical protein
LEISEKKYYSTLSRNDVKDRLFGRSDAGLVEMD